MAADTSVVKAVEAPPLKPIQLKSKLAPTPKTALKYFQKVKNSTGAEVTLADPRASRAAVALMDVHAVVGGAASQVSDSRASDHGLRRCAPAIDTGPAHILALHQRRLFSCTSKCAGQGITPLT